MRKAMHIFIFYILLLMACSKQSSYKYDSYAGEQIVYDSSKETNLSKSNIFLGRYGHQLLELNEKIYLIRGESLKWIDIDNQEKIDYEDIWASSNGIDWDNISNNFLNPWICSKVILVNKQFVLMGGTEKNKALNMLWISNDGVKWQRLYQKLAIPEQDTPKIAYFKKMYYMIGGNARDKNLNSKYALWISKDLISWNQTKSELPFHPNEIIDLFTLSDRVVAHGESAGFFESLDGINWKKIIITKPMVEKGGYALIIKENKVYAIAGYYHSPNDSELFGPCNDVWMSDDYCRTWNLISPLPDGMTLAQAEESQVRSIFKTFPARTDAAATVFKGKIYLVGGISDPKSFGSINYNDTWVSEDGVEWKKISP